MKWNTSLLNKSKLQHLNGKYKENEANEMRKVQINLTKKIRNRERIMTWETFNLEKVQWNDTLPGMKTQEKTHWDKKPGNVLLDRMQCIGLQGLELSIDGFHSDVIKL